MSSTDREDEHSWNIRIILFHWHTWTRRSTLSFAIAISRSFECLACPGWMRRHFLIYLPFVHLCGSPTQGCSLALQTGFRTRHIESVAVAGMQPARPTCHFTTLLRTSFQVGGYEDDDDDIGDLKIKNIQEELSQVPAYKLYNNFRTFTPHWCFHKSICWVEPPLLLLLMMMMMMMHILFGNSLN